MTIDSSITMMAYRDFVPLSLFYLFFKTFLFLFNKHSTNGLVQINNLPFFHCRKFQCLLSHHPEQKNKQKNGNLFNGKLEKSNNIIPYILCLGQQ